MSRGWSTETTVATNAILQRKGARTALITTAGFRDVLELARLRYSKLYDINFVKAEAPGAAPAAIRRRRADGTPGRGEETARRSECEGGHRANPRRGGRGVVHLPAALLRQSRPRAALGRHRPGGPAPHVFITCSVDVLPELREYERTSTTAIQRIPGPGGRGLHRLAHREAEGGSASAHRSRSCSRTAASSTPMRYSENRPRSWSRGRPRG